VSRHYCRLITELIAFKKAEGGTIRDLAREIGIDETALIRCRSGERSPSKYVLTKIMMRYGQLKFVRDLLLHHFAAECQEGYVPSADVFSGVDLPARAVAELRPYVLKFTEENVRGGRGLYIVSSDAGQLSAALRAVALAMEGERIRMQMIRGDQRLDARALRAALAAPVVLIERADFASETVAEVLRRRADLMRPCVVTSMQPPEAIVDPHLRRIAVSTMRLVEIPSANPTDAIRASSAYVHDAT